MQSTTLISDLLHEADGARISWSSCSATRHVFFQGNVRAKLRPIQLDYFDKWHDSWSSNVYDIRLDLPTNGNKDSILGAFLE